MANNNNNDDEEEANLLASLGTSTTSATTYESSILRTAKLKSAPCITLPNVELAKRRVTAVVANNASASFRQQQLIPCGGIDFSLPDLSSLAPSTAATVTTATGNGGGSGGNNTKRSSADVPHVLTILSKVRRDLHSAQQKSLPNNGKINNNSNDNSGINEEEEQHKHTIDVLHMKEQLCLQYLYTVAGEQLCLQYLYTVAGVRDDDGIIPSDNRRKRRRASGVVVGSNNSGGGDAAEDYYGVTTHDNDASAKQPAASARASNGSNRSQQPSILSSSRLNRLDQIKNGQLFNHQDNTTNDNNNTTSNNNSNSNNNSSGNKRKRSTIMSLKSQLRIQSGLPPLKSMEEERYDAEKSRLRREARTKRRLKRRNVLLGINEDESDDEEEEKEFDLDEGEKKSGGADARRGNNNGILKKKSDNDVLEKEDVGRTKRDHAVRWANDDNDDDGNKARAQTKVFCPVCDSILIFNHDENDNDSEEGGGEGDTPDAFLSRHIAECQKSNNGRRSRRGSSNSRRRKKRVVVDYAEEDDFGEEDIDDHAGDNEYDGIASMKEEEGSLNNAEAASNFGKEKNGFTSVYNPTSIDDMDEYDYEDRTDYWSKFGLQQMKSMAEQDSNEIPPGPEVYDGGLEIPAWVNNRLFPYQRIGLRWMWELHCQGAGGVVGDEMGLGKTVQVCSFLGAMAANRYMDSVLIIAPATMLAHWLSELSVWAPGLRRIMMHRSGEADGASRVISKGMLRSLSKWLKSARSDRVNEAIDEDDFNEKGADAFCGTGYAVLATYESIRRSPEDWVSHNWSYVVLDEGQKIRNPDADVTLACKRLRTPHRLLLSGTPIQNDLRELWSLFDFIFPGRLGTLPAFEAEFAVPIKRGGYSNASPMQVQLAYRCSLVLRDLINPYLLRRQKKEIKEVNRMPGKTEQVLFCRLSSKQRRMYEEFLRSDEVMGVMRGSANLLGAVTTLRKICNHTDLVLGPDGTMHPSLNDSSSSSDEEFYEHDDDIADQSGKLQVLSKILPLWKQQGHKVIIFTQWRKMLDIIERFTNMQGWNYARLDGNTNVAARQRLVDKFNNDENYFCMLMTTRTGGVGLNVTGANRVLLYDPDWNPQTDAQARERAWRFGQKRDVTVYRLITAGTIEEKIYQRQIFKTALSNQ
ncbi:hypothetical protein ACHAWC_004157, partial [Mediolabrus comicus]